MDATAKLTSVDRRNVRNICILAHVDHGKTTLSDSLLATNGIISAKLAGRVRYLDSRPDEQERGITMKSSAVSLSFQVRQRVRGTVDSATSSGETNVTSKAKDEANQSAAEPNASVVAESESVIQTYLINLIDSPGHVDFSSEVSVASRLCDGALVLVDVVEGICTQTHYVLLQAWRERVRPVLVLNKIDRVIAELRMTPLEAYLHFDKIIGQANALMAQFSIDERVQWEDRKFERGRKNYSGEIASTSEHVETHASFGGEATEIPSLDDNNAYFSPAAGNVVFCSAVDGWAFRTSDFARIYAQRLGFKEAALSRALWGDYYYDAKAKRVLTPKFLKGKSLKRLVTLSVHAHLAPRSNPDKAEKIVASLQLKVLARDLKSKDSKAAVRAVCSQWLPLSTAILRAVVEQVPNPIDAQAVRIPAILKHMHAEHTTPDAVKLPLLECDPSTGVPVVAYVAKMFAAPVDAIVARKENVVDEDERRKRREELLAQRREDRIAASAAAATDVDAMTAGFADASVTPRIAEESKEKAGVTATSLPAEILLGFARIYSGTISVGMDIDVLDPKYDPAHPERFRHRARVERLFLMMGRELQEVKDVPAGNVFAIHGIHEHVLKCATLSSMPACPSFGAVMASGSSGSGSTTSASQTIMRVAVEPENPADLQAFLRGLKLLHQADPCAQIVVEENGAYVLETAGELHLERCLLDLRERFARVGIHVSAPIVPFRETIAERLSRPGEREVVEATAAGGAFTIAVRCFRLPKEVIALLVDRQGMLDEILGDDREPEENKESVDEFMKTLEGVCERVKCGHLRDITRRLWSLGPKRIGPNMLLNGIPEYQERQRWPAVADLSQQNSLLASLDSSVIAGFQLATAAGPLCNEPMHGVGFVLERFEYHGEQWEANVASLSGQMIACVKDGCRQAFTTWSPRLLLAMYSCEIQATADVLGRVYAVIAKRRGRIVSEEMNGGTSFFSIRALIPVVESIGFSDDLRKRTSGAAQPQLFYAGWEMLDEDPFWQPATDEELEDFGEKADRENLARKYMDGGLFVEDKLVEHAEKQKTAKVK